MLKYIRILLVALFIAALVGAVALFLYNYTHEDTSPPAFRSESDLIEISVTDPQEALLQGLSAYDNVDGNLTSQIRIKDISTLINETDVTVTYIVFDAASNYATCSRTARYTDYRPPRFALNRPMIFSMGETVNFTGSVTVTDQLDGNISGRLKLEQTTVVNSTPGTYTATLSASNRMGDTIYLPLTVQVIDNSVSRPKIELREYLIYLSPGETPDYRSYLSKVTDPMKSDKDKTMPLTSVTVNDAGVDPNVPGVYEVYYYYTGISGEIATVILTVIAE